MSERIFPNTCVGMPIVRGDQPPLTRGIPIVIYYGYGDKPESVRCPVYVDGKCMASRPVPPELAPNCLYVPAKPRPRVAPPPASKPQPEPTYDDIETSFPPNGYLVPSEDAHLLATSSEELGEMVMAEQGFKDTVNTLLDEYASYIKGLGRKPTYKERVRDKVDEDYDHRKLIAFAIGALEAAVDKGGETDVKQTKLLRNHYPEEFTFKYKYAEDAEMESVEIRFPNGRFEIKFEKGVISKIKFVLSDVKSALALHGKERSFLAQKIMSYDKASSAPPRNVSLDFTFGERYAITIETNSEYEQLYYAPPYNKLVKKEDIEGKDGMQTKEFAAILSDVLSILPCGRFDPAAMPQV